LTQEVITIGRETSNLLYINDHGLSRSHASLNRSGADYILKDLGSTNGTFVNGKAVSDSYTLKDGDLISLGEVRGMRWIEPVDLVRKIIGSADALGFSGGEASIHVEYVADVFSQCQDHGIRTILETNGYMTRSTAEKLAKYTNHVSFGLKASLDQAYYKHNLGIEEAEPIREAAKVFAENGCEVILTNLTDPNLWDDRLAFETLTKWIARDLGIEVRLALGSLERGELPPPWTEERIHITSREQRHAHLEGYRKVAMDAGLQRVFCILCSPRVGRQPQTREPLTTAIDFD